MSRTLNYMCFVMLYCMFIEQGAYFRFVTNSESIKCLFVLGKCRIAPLKSLTVYRLELSAATIAVKLAHSVCQEIEHVIVRTVSWTDASVVLRCIQNMSSRYMYFVANRLELIHTLGTPQKWRCVPTDLNSADIGYREFRLIGLT